MFKYQRRPLDRSLYCMDPKVAKVFKKSTGIVDDEELKTHIIKEQEKAYDNLPYPFIRIFTFARYSVTELPCYNDVLQLGKERNGAILLEVGAGFGNDIRNVIYDGYPAQNAVAVDITTELWEVGHRLYRSDAQSFPVKFVQADIFDETVLSSETTPSLSPPELKNLKSLTPLKSHVSVILIQYVFHLFDQERQVLLAQRLAQLLSPLPGSLILGKNLGDVDAKDVTVYGSLSPLHNPATWEKMWSTIFPPGTVEYNTVLIDIPPEVVAVSGDRVGPTHFLLWSIRRL